MVNKIYKYLLLLVVCLTGLMIGKSIGYFSTIQLLRGKSKLSLLLSVPVTSFLKLNIFLNSEDLFRRSAAYYGLADYAMIDIEFLEERLAEEKLLFTKKIIVWSISQSADKKKSLSSLKKIFEAEKGYLKFYTLKQIKLIDYNIYLKSFQAMTEQDRIKFRKTNKKKSYNINYRT